jgi:hypothetical protein
MHSSAEEVFELASDLIDLLADLSFAMRKLYVENEDTLRKIREKCELYPPAENVCYLKNDEHNKI